jgi:putative endonuclease
MNRKTTGDHAEQLACSFLQQQGLHLITRNYRCRRGEIDLIMRHGDSLVFVEVRYRRRSAFGTPAETVSSGKQAHIIHCANCYLTQKRAWNEPARFDVVCVAGSLQPRRIEWLQNAFCLDR